MSDDPNRPDAGHELGVDLNAFLPEGSRFATDDDEPDETNPVDDAVPAYDAAPELGEAAASAPAAGSGEASDDDANTDVSADVEPSGSDVASDDGWDTGAPAPEIPAWARDGLPPLPVVDGPDQPVDGPGVSVDGAVQPVEDDASQPPPVADIGPAVPAPPEVDTTVLTRIEGELADVDTAIAAIDAGDLARSPLLTNLLAADQPEATSPDTRHG